MKTPPIRLVSVYRSAGSAELLYRLLGEREKKMNISHLQMPTWQEHTRFLASKPYKGWFLIKSGRETVGAVYLSKQNEIGLFIFRKFWGSGFGRAAADALMDKFPKVERFLANINPANSRSIRFFTGRGFRHIQNTYEWRRKR
jgi:RimJ/RimL family protein N-acetyltransferase